MLFLQKNAKFSSAGGSAPRPPKKPPPLRISNYAPEEKHELQQQCTVVGLWYRRHSIAQ